MPPLSFDLPQSHHETAAHAWYLKRPDAKKPNDLKHATYWEPTHDTAYVCDRVIWVRGEACDEHVPPLQSLP